MIIAGSEETKKKYLGRMTEEPLVAGYCVTDTVTGPNGTAKTRAEKKGDKWILDGSGVWITNGSHANWFFVLATSKRFAMPRSSMTAFVVDANTPGIFFGKKEITMGQRCSDTRMLIFDNIEVPEENVLGSVGDGFKVAMNAFKITRPLVASGAVGLARRALEEATKCAQEREITVPSILADMTSRVESSRAHVWRAARAKDAGLDNDSEASHAKTKAFRAAFENTYKAVQKLWGLLPSTPLRSCPATQKHLNAPTRKS